MPRVSIHDAPGCIGSPILRRSNHEICKACRFGTVCAKLSERNAKLLAEDLGVDSIDPEVVNQKTGVRSNITPATGGKKKPRDPGALSPGAQKLIVDLKKDEFDETEIRLLMQSTTVEAAKEQFRKITSRYTRVLFAAWWQCDASISRAKLREALTNSSSVVCNKLLAEAKVKSFVAAMVHLKLATLKTENLNWIVK